MKTLLSLTFCAALFTPSLVFAQPTQYELLAPIPLQGVSGGDTATTSAGDYIKGIFKLTIAIATGLAVIMIIFGGIKYMSTDAFSGKSEAKLIIENALWGLLLAIGAWIILYTINPKLVEFDLGLPKQEIPVNTNVPGPTSGPGPGPSTCPDSNPSCSPRFLGVFGYTPTQANTMSCIALAESGGDPNEVNPDGGACGTFQILPSNWRNPRLHRDPCSSSVNCRSAFCNAQTASILSQNRLARGQSAYSDWTCERCDPRGTKRACVDKYDPGH